MKSKNSLVTLGIIALVLFLGVGYAVVSSVYLNIGGTASVDDQDLKVESNFQIQKVMETEMEVCYVR